MNLRSIKIRKQKWVNMFQENVKKVNLEKKYTSQTDEFLLHAVKVIRNLYNKFKKIILKLKIFK